MGAKKMNQRTNTEMKIEKNTDLQVIRNENKEAEIKETEKVLSLEDAKQKENEELEKEMMEFFDKKEAEEKAKEQKAEVKRVLTLDEKIQKIKELGILTDKRKNLVESKNKLSEFAIGTTSEGQKLELIDSNKRVYNISNSDAIIGVINYLKSFLDDRIKDVENQISFE